ncbi:alpha/beta hydrolase [Roseiterribacter gracilis]|uniref:AB hydrolase-1 domain-containing protein n=1 Tax=Roseiterribacter gracilis TaxID=2812848 RepID=A0A8S8XG75_9PROT|nr:hypothetical protein TMPK1_32090 [Rhodospirillales bacterium TMPK1]
MKFRGLAAALVLLGLTSSAHAQDGPPGETIWLKGATHRLKARAYRSPASSDHPQLVVVLHGDSPFRNPSYQYLFARRAAASNVDVVAVGLLRPGYTDGDGETSDGERGRTTGDNYTKDVVADVATAVDELKALFAARSVVLVGHSGGAAIVGNVIGTTPNLADGAMLVSCPCDLPAFRRHMFWKQWAPFWLLPVDSLSPLALVDRVRPTTQVQLLVGSDDELTPPRFTQLYADMLKARGGNVSVTILPGQPHDILLEPPVFASLTAMLQKMEAR